MKKLVGFVTIPGSRSQNHFAHRVSLFGYRISKEGFQHVEIPLLLLPNLDSNQGPTD